MLSLEIQIILLTIILILALSVWFCFKIDNSQDSNLFTAGKILIYFNLIEIIVLLWFALNPRMFDVTISPLIPDKYYTPEILIRAYFMSVVMFLSTYLGIFVASYRLRIGQGILNRFIINPVSDLNRTKLWILLYAIGMGMYFFVLNRLGGFIEAWINIGLFDQASQGLGVYLTIYPFLLYIAGVAIFTRLYKANKKRLAYIFLIFTALVLVSLSHRAQLATFIFITIIVWNFKIKKIESLLSMKFLLMGVFLIVFMVIMVTLRSLDFNNLESAGDVNLIEKLSSDVFLRLGTIERKMVVLGYFDQNPLWFGKSYAGLIEGFKSSAAAISKPLVDTGVYLKEISLGHIITPPQPTSKMDATSWPEGNLAGYMNFHFIGLIVLCYLSGYFFGFSYRIAKNSNYAFGAVFLFGILSYMGGPNLSPYGFFRFSSTIILFVCVAIFALFTQTKQFILKTDASRR